MTKVKIIVEYEYTINPEHYPKELKTDLERMKLLKKSTNDNGTRIYEFADEVSEKWSLK